jgi:hypothetical protein
MLVTQVKSRSFALPSKRSSNQAIKQSSNQAITAGLYPLTELADVTSAREHMPLNTVQR